MKRRYARQERSGFPLMLLSRRDARDRLIDLAFGVAHFHEHLAQDFAGPALPFGVPQHRIPHRLAEAFGNLVGEQTRMTAVAREPVPHPINEQRMAGRGLNEAELAVERIKIEQTVAEQSARPNRDIGV